MTLRHVLFFLLLSAMPMAGADQQDRPEPEPAEAQEAIELVPSEGLEAAESVPSEGPKTTEVTPSEKPESADSVPSEEPEIVELVAPERQEPADVEPERREDADQPALPDPHFVGPPEPSPDYSEGEPGAGEESEKFVILGHELAPGELRQFNWQLETAMAGLAIPTPVLVARGREPGPTLCLVAAVHGDELNGVEIVRRIMFELDLDKMAGNVVGMPIANAFGFLRSSRYLPDRRDLNRFFPGDAQGSMASRFAHALFTEVISRCNVLVDIHTASFYRTNLPQLRADLMIPSVLELSRQFGDIAVLHSVSPGGSLRRAATDAGIAAVTMETGGPARFQKGAVEAGVKAIESLLNQLGMLKRFRLFGEPQPVIYDSTWVRAETGGILLAEVDLGATVEKGQRLGTVTDPIQNKREVLEAPFRGRLLGMAVNQVVMPGFAAFHIGRAADEKEAIQSSIRSGEQADAEHADDAIAYSDEDEFFDPATAGDDEPEPGLSPGVTEPIGEVYPPLQEDFSTRLDILWLQELEQDEPPECIQPPLIAC